MTGIGSLPPLPREGQEAMKIQEWFSDLNETNIERTANLIYASQYARQKDHTPTLVNELIRVIPLRTDLTPFIEMLKILRSRQSQTNAIQYLFTLIASSSLALNVEYNVHIIVPYLYFLRKLVTAKVIEIWDLVVQIKRFVNNKPNLQFLCLCYFAPEIQYSDKEYYAYLKEKALEMKVTEPILAPHQQNWAELEANGFQILKEYVDFGVRKSSMEYMLLTDNVNEFRKYFEANKIEFNVRIPENAFTPVEFVQWSPYAIEYATFYGSVNCVKYLIEKGASPTNIAQYAIAGASMTMIQFCQNNHISFKNSLRLAPYYRRLDIYTYVMPLIKKPNLGKELGFCMVTAAGSNDIRIFRQICLDGGYINFYDENKETPLIIATKKGNVEMAKYILTFPNVKKDVANCWGKTAADLAPKSLQEVFAPKKKEKEN